MPSKSSSNYVFFPNVTPALPTFASEPNTDDFDNDAASDAYSNVDHASLQQEPLFQPSKSVKRPPRKNNKELSPLKSQSRSRSAMDNAAEYAHDNVFDTSVRPEELRVKDEQIKVLTEANMELATKLQLLEEAMVGSDSVMERRSEMMRALAGENFELLAMLEVRESGGMIPGMQATGGDASFSQGQTEQIMSQEGTMMSQSPDLAAAPFEAWGEESVQPDSPNSGYVGHVMPGTNEARKAIQEGVNRLTRHRPLIGQEERAVALGTTRGGEESAMEMRDIVGQIAGLDRDIFDGPKATRKHVVKQIPLQMIDEKEVVRLRVETHALRMFKLKCNEEIVKKEEDMLKMQDHISGLKRSLSANNSQQSILQESVRLSEEKVRSMTDQYAMMTNRYHDEEENRLRLAEELSRLESQLKIKEEEAFILRTRNSAVVNRWVKARHRAVEHELKETITELSAMLEEEEAARSKGEEELQKKQLELELMRERHHVLLNDLLAAQEEAKMCRKAREDALEKKKEAQEAVKVLQLELDVEVAKTVTMRTEMKDLESRLEELNKMKESLLGKVKELEREISDLKKTLQQIYQKHADQIGKMEKDYEEKIGILKAYTKTKDEECRSLSAHNAEITKFNQLAKANISDLEKQFQAKVDEMQKASDDSSAKLDEILAVEKNKQDVLKTYARKKDQELKDRTAELAEMSRRFNSEQLRREKGDAAQKQLSEDHRMLGLRYSSLQQGYDREMSMRERLEDTVRELERNLRTDMQRNDSFHRRKFQELAELQAQTLHKLNYEQAAREDAEMALIHKQEEIFELRGRCDMLKEAKEQADQLQGLVDEESKQLHTRVRELLGSLSDEQAKRMASDERAQKAESVAALEVEQVRSETNMVLEAKMQELRATEDECDKIKDEVMAITIAMENAQLQAAKDIAQGSDEIATLKTGNEELSFRTDEMETSITKATEDADIALREVQALRERSPEALSSIKDEKIRNLEALEKSLEARLKKTEDSRALATGEQRSKEKECRDVKIELMEKTNQLEQFKREFLSKEQLADSANLSAGNMGDGNFMTDIEDPISRRELEDCEAKLQDTEAEVSELDKMLRIEERLKTKLQNEIKEKDRELHKFLIERDSEVKELLARGKEEMESSASASKRKEVERQSRKEARNSERAKSDAEKALKGKAKAPAGGGGDAKATEEDPLAGFSDADKEKFKQVFDFVRFNKYKEVDKLIKEGCPVDWRDSNGYTPLMVASQNGLKRIVKVLLRYSCDMNAQNHRGHTGAHLANMYDHPDIMEYLVSKGARDDILNEQGKTCHNATK